MQILISLGHVPIRLFSCSQEKVPFPFRKNWLEKNVRNKFELYISESLSRLSEVVAPSYNVPVETSTSPVNENQTFMFHSNVHGISEEKERRLRELYERLDMNKDGTIDIRDLTNALKQKAPHIPSGVIPELFARIDHLNDDIITFAEFVQYAVEHEKKLEIIFRDLDRNKDGFVGVQEIKKYCEDLGLPITGAKAQGIVESMARTGSASVNFSEFKDFMLLYPRSKPEEIAKFWKHNLMIDIGEDSQIPEDFSQQEIASGFWWKHLVAGGVAGFMSRTCTAPLDRVKIYLQVHASLLNRLRFPKAAKLLYEEGGLKSFWRGNGVNVAKIAPESAIKFLSYDLVKRLIIRHRDEGHKLQISERFAAGSAAGIISQTIIYPLEVLKTRLALRHSSQLDRNFVNFAAKMYRNEGVLCFYKGIVPNLIGIIPYAGIDLAIYETLKNYYLNNYNTHPVRDIVALPVCGACSSICGMLASYPFVLVRTRLQALAISDNLTQPHTMIGQIQHIWRNDGLYGFYRGLTANLMKAVPAVAISYYVYENMRSVRDTGLVFPSTLTSDEKRLKEAFEKLRIIRKAIAATNKVNVNATVGDNLKAERKTTKRHLQQAQEATEEVKRKVLIGAVSFKKADEKKNSFKRSSLIGRRQNSGKTKTDNNTVNSSGMELVSSNINDSFDACKPFSSDDHSEMVKTTKEPSDSFDTYKPACDDTSKNTVFDASGTCKAEPNAISRCISTGRIASDNTDTSKTTEGADVFDNYKSSVGDSDFGTNAPSSFFDIYKPVSLSDDGFDTYKPRSAQSFSLDANRSSPFGPCLYIRGYDLVADSLRNVFGKFGVINRVFVEERQKSAFITYATTEEAEVAIKEMDGNMVNGITLRVSFARRQNQYGDSGRFRSGKSFDRNNDGGNKSGGDRCNRFRGEKNNRFRGNEHVRFRGEKSGRNRGRERTYESVDSLLPATETEKNDDFWPEAKIPSDSWSTAETRRRDKDDFWAAEKQSPGKTSEWPSAERNDEKGDSFDTYKSTISTNEREDCSFLKSNEKDDSFDTYKPFDNNQKGDSSTILFRETVNDNCQENFGKRQSDFDELLGDERRRSSSGDRCRNFRSDGRYSGMSRRGSRNRGGPSWRSKKQENELRDVDHCTIDNLDIDRKSSWLTRDESGERNDFRTSNTRYMNAQNKNDSDSRENKSQERAIPNYQFSSKSDESGIIERSNEDQPFRGNKRGDYRSGRRGGDRGGFRRQRRDFDNKSRWPDDEEGKSSCYDEWPNVCSKSSLDAWPALSDDKASNSSPPLPPMSEVQVAWSEATKKTSKEMATTLKKEEITIMQHKTEIRTQVSYAEDDPFA
ncbi:putative calcium-binding mitochondrial carrier F55A11.4 [Dirofilaria immitis]